MEFVRKRVKKIAAGGLGIALILLLLLFVNSSVGNPVSKALAQKAAEQYMNKTYKELDLKLVECSYSFKEGAYRAFLQSQTSEDTAFGIYVNGYGNVLRDDYAFEVANHFTTYRRLDQELRITAEEMIGSRLDYDFESIHLSFIKDMDLMDLELDLTLDIHNPPIPLIADITFYNRDLSYSKIAEMAKAVESVLQEEKVSVQEYSIRILPFANKPKEQNGAASWVNSLSISYFPSERMKEKDLAKVMEEFETERVMEENRTSEK